MIGSQNRDVTGVFQKKKKTKPKKNKKTARDDDKKYARMRGERLV
jgi:hypothetical protein